MQNAYNDGKIITSVTPTEGISYNGWLITFSDSSTIEINSGIDGIDGVNGITPYLKVDENGYWTVSYDNGTTFNLLLDKNSNPIVAVGKDGEQGPQGVKGEDGNSVRVVTNEQSYYIIEVYNPTTGAVVESIQTQYTTNPQNIVKSIVEDGKNNVIKITMESGQEFIFPKGEILSPARFLFFNFLARNNPISLITDVEFDIVGDSILSCFIPYMIEDKNFIPTFECADAKVYFEDEEVISGETKLDCSLPINLVVASANDTTSYLLEIKYYTGLPIVYINTEEKKAIDSKENYVNGNIRIVQNAGSQSIEPVFESEMKIKGRGNSTWNLPKKPYKIKFDSKKSLMGFPADKEWVLLANYTDKTQLRNELAFFMGRISSFEYTPRTAFVEVIINGVYNGTYQLTEQLKISKNRVNVGDDGYLMEIDSKASEEDITFQVPHIGPAINIKDPDIEVGSEAYEYLVDYMNKADAALFSESFTDPEIGYAKYFDVTSFADWYIINEIAKNNDAIFWTSCYMNLSRDGKLKMGALWDYDIAFGNVDYGNCGDPEGFYIKDIPWFIRLFEDPEFVSLVKERFEYFYSQKDIIFLQINENADYLKYAAIENNNKWGTLYNYTWPNNEILGSYQNEVQNMKNWLYKRFEWLNTAILAL